MTLANAGDRGEKSTRRRAALSSHKGLIARCIFASCCRPPSQHTWIAYIWAPDQIEVVLEAWDRWTTLVRIETPVGAIELLGEVSFQGRLMRIDRAHIGGLSAGKLGRGGLNAIGAKLLVEGDVDEIIIEGSNRTTGRNAGRPPRVIRFPSRSAPDET